MSTGVSRSTKDSSETLFRKKEGQSITWEPVCCCWQSRISDMFCIDNDCSLHSHTHISKHCPDTMMNNTCSSSEWTVFWKLPSLNSWRNAGFPVLRQVIKIKEYWQQREKNKTTHTTTLLWYCTESASYTVLTASTTGEANPNWSKGYPTPYDIKWKLQNCAWEESSCCVGTGRVLVSGKWAAVLHIACFVNVTM